MFHSPSERGESRIVDHHGDSHGGSNLRWPRLRRFRYSLKTLLLLSVFVAVLLGIGPRLVEELDPIESEMVAMQYGQYEWSVDESGRNYFNMEIIATSEEPFRLCFWRDRLGDEPLNKKSPLGMSSGRADRTLIGKFVPERHFLGHNYTLSMRLLVSSEKIRISNGENGSLESRLFTDLQHDRRVKLVSVFNSRPGGGLVGDKEYSLGKDLEVSFLPIVFTDSQTQDGSPKRIELTIWMEIESVSP